MVLCWNDNSHRNFLMHIVLFGINSFRNKHLNAEQEDDVEAAGIQEEPLQSE